MFASTSFYVRKRARAAKARSVKSKKSDNKIVMKLNKCFICCCKYYPFEIKDLLWDNKVNQHFLKDIIYGEKEPGYDANGVENKTVRYFELDNDELDEFDEDISSLPFCPSCYAKVSRLLVVHNQAQNIFSQYKIVREELGFDVIMGMIQNYTNGPLEKIRRQGYGKWYDRFLSKSEPYPNNSLFESMLDESVRDLDERKKLKKLSPAKANNVEMSIEETITPTPEPIDLNNENDQTNENFEYDQTNENFEYEQTNENLGYEQNENLENSKENLTNNLQEETEDLQSPAPKMDILLPLTPPPFETVATSTSLLDFNFNFDDVQIKIEQPDLPDPEEYEFEKKNVKRREFRLKRFTGAPVQKDLWTCPLCDRFFYLKNQLDAHLAARHQKNASS